MKTLALLVALLLFASPAWGQVVYDNTASITGAGVTSVTTGAFTITASNNRAGVLGLSVNNGNNITSLIGNIGGTASAAISGADSGAIAQRALMHRVIAPPSGSQTASMSWVTSSDAVLGVVTASGVNQTTPVNNGTTNSGVGATASVAITSTAGDLTVDTVMASQNTAFTAPTQTPRWNTNASGNDTGAGSTGPGTGTTTHQWTNLGVTWKEAGANLVASPCTQRRTLMRVGC